MNTCKSVSKQRTLTTFRITHFRKTPGGCLAPEPRGPVKIMPVASSPLPLRVFLPFRCSIGGDENSRASLCADSRRLCLRVICFHLRANETKTGRGNSAGNATVERTHRVIIGRTHVRCCVHPVAQNRPPARAHGRRFGH